ncbi:MAG: adenylosuccinate synthase [Gemmatimonadales bacterium]|nr:MAG: adenylosuccinate synthase [Gemmatimonadales bacterium]
MSSRTDADRCTVVVGCQWGDEGKGKIVDVLAEDVDVVARYQGGANAGHTVHVGDSEFILHQIPSGILHPGKRCLLGNGVVLDLLQFFEEHDALVARGIDLEGRVGVSLRAHLLLPWHRVLDRAAEAGAAEKIGTTGRGIGPAYEDKAGRRGIRVADAADLDRFSELMARGTERARKRLLALGLPLDGDDARALDEAMEQSAALRERILELAVDTGLEVDQALRAGERVLLEGAQGTALDLDHGTYPFVTSSNTTAAGAATGIGIGPTRIDAVLGVVKAYTTRVGNGPLPTGFDDEMDARMRELGGEFGATTGRPRRCGWFDAVLARYAARVNGLTGLAVTKLDVLDTLPEIGLCTGYRLPDGSTVTEFPADTWSLESIEPVLEMVPGWESSTQEARTLDDLPAGARSYLDRIEELTGAPIHMVSVGTRRTQIIHVA